MKSKLIFIDNLRALLISLIVLLHLAITYGAPGDWYVHEIQTNELDELSLIVFSLYNATVQAFALGFFFFISGYFTASSVERKGARIFLVDRVTRLGIPLIVYSFVLNPITIYFLRDREQSFVSYYIDCIADIRFNTGPLWFVAALFVFSVSYTLLRPLLKNIQITTYTLSLSGILKLYGIIIIVGIAAFVLRFFFPVGWSLPILNFQFGYFPGYLATFLLGTLLWRIRWFEHLSSYRSYVWGAYVTVIITFLPVMLILSGAEGGIDKFTGGFFWQALTYAVWEPFVCLGMILFLSSLFARRLNRSCTWLRSLTSSTYAVYVIHTQVLLLLTSLATGLALPPLLKFIVMSPIVLTACFLIALTLRKFPGVARVL